MNPLPVNPDEWNVIKTLKSKKNTVKKVEFEGEHYIVKEYDPEFISGKQVEEEILKNCDERGVPVPKIIGSSEDTLIMEFVSGKNCKRLYDSTDDETIRKNVLDAIANWLSEFHKSFDYNTRRGDCILANFILKDEKVYGIDFEESEKGDPFRDVGDMSTSILRLRPEFTEERFSQMRFFIDKYFSDAPVPRKDLTEPVALSLLHYSKYSSMGELMKEWAQKIRSNGLSKISQS